MINDDITLKEILGSQLPSFAFDKVITLIYHTGKGYSVTQHQYKDFEKLIKKFDKFKVKGYAKPTRLKKYIQQIENLNYKIDKKSIKNAGFDGKNSDVLQYYITFEKK